MTAIFTWLMSMLSSFFSWFRALTGSLGTAANSVMTGITGAAGGTGAVGGQATGFAGLVGTILSLGSQATLLNEAGALRLFGGKNGPLQAVGNILSNPAALIGVAVVAFLILRK